METVTAIVIISIMILIGVVLYDITTEKPSLTIIESTMFDGDYELLHNGSRVKIGSNPPNLPKERPSTYKNISVETIKHEVN